MENGNWKIETRNSKTDIRKSSPCLLPFPREKSTLSLGERVARDGVFISRRGSGEGLLQSRAKLENGNWKIESRCSRQAVTVPASPCRLEVPASFVHVASFLLLLRFNWCKLALKMRKNRSMQKAMSFVFKYSLTSFPLFFAFPRDPPDFPHSGSVKPGRIPPFQATSGTCAASKKLENWI